MLNLLGTTLFAGVMGCRQSEAEALTHPIQEVPTTADSPLTMTLDPDQTLDTELAARIQMTVRKVMEQGRVVSTDPVLGKALTIEGRTVRVFNHLEVRYPDVFVMETSERTCADFGLDGNVNDCQTYEARDPKLFNDSRWRTNFPSVEPSIGLPFNLSLHGEENRSAYQAWFKENVTAFESGM